LLNGGIEAPRRDAILFGNFSTQFSVELVEAASTDTIALLQQYADTKTIR
jgi:hypothetical protein